MPDEVVAQGGDLLDQAAAASTPEASPAAPPSQDTSVASSGVPASPAAPASAPTPPSFLEQLRSSGINLPNDEGQALNALQRYFHDAQQAQQYAQYGQYYLQHAKDFEAWRNSQQQQAPKAQEDGPWWKDYWNPPEYNPAWRGLLTTDEQGNIVARPGSSPDILPKYLAYRQHRDDTIDKFFSNPYSFMEAPVKKLAEQVAMEAVQKHLGQYSDRQSASSFVQQNAHWLYQTDPNTNQVMVHPVSRQPLLSSWGDQFRNYVLRAEQLGLDRMGQEDYAITAIQRDMAYSQLQATTGQAAPPAAPVPSTPREAANQNFVQRAVGRPARAPAAATPAQAPPVGSTGLAQMLAKKFAEHGITNDALKENK